MGWPLVGRSAELDLLVSALSGTRRAVLVSGPAGVGKSRLAAAALDRLAEAGWATERLVATRSTGGIEFGALAHLLPDDGAIPTGSLEVMRQVRRQVRRRGRDRPVVLGVDDAHLLDRSSAAAVHLLASTGVAAVLATVRAQEPAPDAVTALGRDELGLRLELGPLSYAQVGKLLETVLGGQVARTTQHRLWQATRGNMLYLRELVREGLERTVLCERGRIWSWAGDLRAGRRLVEIVDDRLGELDAAERAIVETLAVGEPLGPAFFDDLPRLTALEDRGLVSVGQAGRRTTIRLAHPLYAEAVQARLGSLRRREIAAALAAVMAKTGARRRGDLLRLATWDIDGGGDRDPETLVAAARQARAQLDYWLTQRLAEAAIEAGAGPDAHVLLGDAFYSQGEHEKARAVLESAPEDAAASPDAVVWRAITTASTWFWGLGKAAEAEKVLGAAEERLAPRPERDELAAHRALMVVFNGRPVEGAAIALPILAAPTATDVTRARALMAVIPAYAVTGRTEEAIGIAEAGARVAADVADDEPGALGLLRAGQAGACFLAGRFRDMHALADRMYRRALADGADDTRGMWATLLGQALLSRGLARSALVLSREAAELLRRNNSGGFLSWCLATVAHAAVLLGDLDEAAAAAAEAAQRHLPAVRTHDALLAVANARILAAQGEKSAARRIVLEALDRAAERQQCAVEALLAHQALRLGVTGLADRLDDLRSSQDGPIAAVYAAHARAVETGDTAALDRVATAFDELDAPLLAAESAAQAAEIHRMEGRTGGHLAALARCRDFAARCEGASTPILDSAGEPPAMATLTAREREIADLAARSLTNQQIADTLVLSRRTVENHLGRIYAKLDVSTREELTLVINLRDKPAS